jgi:transcriptional regulator with XRE-family HTH domain
MTFVIRKLQEEQTLGEQLRALRHLANVTLTEMAEQTKIQKSYLQAFEESAFHRLPEPLYVRNFLRTYVRALGGDETYFLERFESERGTCDFMDGARLPRRRARAIQFLVASRFVKFSVLGLFSLALVSYLGLQLRAITAPPQISVTEPADGLTTDDASVNVTGTVQGATRVLVNGEEVLLDKQGIFEIDVALERGLNVITVEGAKRYSRSATIYRRVMLSEDRKTAMSP